MPEERDPVYRWVGEHQRWAFVIAILFVVCIFVTIAGFAFATFNGSVGTPPPTASP